MGADLTRIFSSKEWTWRYDLDGKDEVREKENPPYNIEYSDTLGLKCGDVTISILLDNEKETIELIRLNSPEEGIHNEYSIIVTDKINKIKTVYDCSIRNISNLK